MQRAGLAADRKCGMACECPECALALARAWNKSGWRCCLCRELANHKEQGMECKRCLRYFCTVCSEMTDLAVPTELAAPVVPVGPKRWGTFVY